MLSKNDGHHGWLKRPKAVPQKIKIVPKYKWFKISFLEFTFFICLFFWKYYFGHPAFLYLSRRSTRHHKSLFFFNFRFSSRKSQSQQKLAKKITHHIQITSKKVHIQFWSKSLTLFTDLNSLDIENNMLPQHSQKPFSLYKFSGRHVFVWCQKKYLHCTLSWRPRTAFLMNLQMSVYFYISPYKNICFQRCSKILSEGGWVAGRLNNFLKAVHILCLEKYFTMFYFNWNFWKFNYFSAFRYSIYSIKTLKFYRQFELQG